MLHYFLMASKRLFSQIPTDCASDPYWNNVVLMMHMDKVGTDLTTFLDETGKVVTRHGNAVISSDQHKFGEYAGYFNGAGDYLTVPYSDSWNFSADFTIEFWINLLAYKADSVIFVQTNIGGQYCPILIREDGVFISSTGSSWDVCAYAPYATYVIGIWTHIAITRKGSTFTFFQDGVVKNTVNFTGTLYHNTESHLCLMGVNFDNTAGVNGYIDELRITKGVARYSANSTTLLLNFDQSGFIDETGKSLSEVGNPTISGEQKKFGNTSCYFDGTDDRLYVTSVDFSVGIGDFTLEAWVYPTTPSRNQGILQLSGTAGGLQNNETANLAICFDQLGRFVCYAANIATFSNVAYTVNTWYHAALVRKNGMTSLFVNGIKVISLPDSTNYTGTNLVVGGFHSAPYLFQGYIDDVRISPKAAEYVAQGDVLLLHFDEDPLVDAGGKSLTFYGNPVRNNTVSRFGGYSGIFGANDYIHIQESNDFAFEIDDFTIDFWMYPTAWSLGENNVYGNMLDGRQYSPTGHRNLAPIVFIDATQKIRYSNGYSSTAFKEETGKTVTLVGSPTINNVVHRQGTGCLFLRGGATTDAMSFAASADFFLGTTFTIEGWLHPLSFAPSGNANRIIMIGSNGTTTALCIEIHPDGNLYLGRPLGGSVGIYGGALKLNAWTHFAISVNSNVARTFINGRLVSGPTTIVTQASSSPTLRIGYDTVGTRDAKYHGYIDNLRISKGIARYADNFDHLNISSAIDSFTKLYCQFDQNIFVQSATTIELNRWYHVVVSRYKRNTQLIVNGNLEGSVVDSSIYPVCPLTVGNMAKVLIDGGLSATDFSYQGYLDELRIIKGRADYSAYGENLLLHFDGANNSTVFTDATGKTVTRYGDAKISTVQSKFGGSSGYFDGSGDYLSVPASADFNLPGDFTIECWVYIQENSTLDPTSNRHATILNIGSSDGNVSNQVIITGNSSRTGTGLTIYTKSSQVAHLVEFHFDHGIWYHVAVCQQNKVSNWFVNGVNIGSQAYDVVFGSASAPMTIGGQTVSGWSRALNGYIDELRIIKGKALYTENFTPATKPHEHIACWQDSLLLHFDGANNSTVFTDATGKTVTRYGDAKISTVQSKFGGSSGYFDGSGDYLSVPASADFNFGTGDFTIECWVNIQGLSPKGNDNVSYSAVLLQTGGGGGTENLTFGINGHSTHTGTAIFLYSQTSPFSASADFYFEYDQWYHVVAEKHNNKIRLFVDGINIHNSDISSLSLGTSTNTIAIGGSPNVGGWPRYLNGYIDELRIIKGKALYTENFTPPNAPTEFVFPVFNQHRTPEFPRLTAYSDDPYRFNTDLPPIDAVTVTDHTKLLLHFDGVQGRQFIDETGKAVTVHGNTVVSNQQSKFGGYSGYFDGSGDYLTIPSSNDFVFGTGDFTVETWIYPSVAQTNKAVVSNRNSYSEANWAIELYSTANRVEFHSGWTIYAQAANPLPSETWTHLVVQRHNGVLTILYDGVVQANAPCAANFSLTNNLNIGYEEWAVHLGYFNGYLDDLRITKGEARYKTYGDVLLMHMDDLTEASGKTVSVSGNTAISAVQSKFGGYSAYFDGSSYLSLPGSDDFAFGVGDFTIDCWICPLNVANSNPLFLGSGGDYGTMFIQFRTAPYVIGLCKAQVGWPVVFTGSTIQNNTWTHLAIVRKSGLTYCFVDGMSICNPIPDSNDWTFGSTLYIGTASGSTNAYAGYIDELRITKGLARYTDNFTPPTQPHTYEPFLTKDRSGNSLPPTQALTYEGATVSDSNPIPPTAKFPSCRTL